MNLDAALQTFIAESRELLEQMEQALLAIDAGTCDDATVNALFRAAHTIKGSAGLFGLDDIVAFTHVVENVLDRIRALAGFGRDDHAATQRVDDGVGSAFESIEQATHADDGGDFEGAREERGVARRAAGFRHEPEHPRVAEDACRVGGREVGGHQDELAVGQHPAVLLATQMPQDVRTDVLEVVGALAKVPVRRGEQRRLQRSTAQP